MSRPAPANASWPRPTAEGAPLRRAITSTTGARFLSTLPGGKEARPGAPHIYILALGSNQPRSRICTPKRLVLKAVEALSSPPFRLLARSPIIETPPLGPSKRRYANAAILLETADFAPDALLRHLKVMERAAGRRPGLRWGSRPLDLDIIAWNGGRWRERNLIIPHKEWSRRRFVLEPVNAIAPGWKDPQSGKSVRQMLAILKKPRKMRKGG